MSSKQNVQVLYNAYLSIADILSMNEFNFYRDTE